MFIFSPNWSVNNKFFQPASNYETYKNHNLGFEKQTKLFFTKLTPNYMHFFFIVSNTVESVFGFYELCFNRLSYTVIYVMTN